MIIHKRWSLKSWYRYKCELKGLSVVMLLKGPGCRRKNIGMAKGIICTCIFISISAISAAGVRENNQESRKRTETNLVSNLFSELGNLFLDIDETLTIQTAPKIELEGLVAQLLRPSNEHFRDVQGNYRTLQRRLGTFILQSAPKSSYTAQDLSTIAPPTQGLESVQDLVTPASFENVEALKTMEESEDPSQNSLPLSGISNECSVDILVNPFLEPDRRRECSQRLKRHIHTDNRFKRPVGRKGIESRRKNHLLVPLETDELYPHPHGFFRRDGDVAESTPKSQGRIFGDILYSESSFDKNLRQLLRDHGKWILDNPLLTRWRKATSKDDSDVTTEAPTTEAEISTDSSSDTTLEMESTQAYVPITEEYNTEIPRQVSLETLSEKKLPLKSASYYRLTNNDAVVGEEIEMVLNPDLNVETVHVVETDNELNLSPEESVILAFTQDGIPLKLRIGPEIENPTRFLHTVLKFAGTSLNVPVKSHDDIQPVGQEVLKFGVGILTRPAYYDLSNRDDLKNLVRTLMKSKESGS